MRSVHSKVFEDVLTKEIETWRSFIDKLPSDEDKVVMTTNTLMIISIRQKLITMVVMMTCKNCGYEYESKVLQTPDEEFLIFKPHENILENYPKGYQIPSYNGPDLYWVNPSELEL